MKSKKTQNPNIRIGGKKTAPRIAKTFSKGRDMYSPMKKEDAVKAVREVALHTLESLRHELAEARWQRTNAYNIGRLPTRFVGGREITGGFRNCTDDDIRRLYCDMWVRSLLKLHKLILGLVPEPDDTEKEFPLKNV